MKKHIINKVEANSRASNSNIRYNRFRNAAEKLLVIIITFCLFHQIISCKKFVTVGAPPTSINEENVYKNDATSISVLTGIYSRISQSSGLLTGTSGIFLKLGCSADEFSLAGNLTDNTLISYYGNALVSTSGGQDWGPIYNYIFQCNAAIQGLTHSTSLTPAVQQQLIGEAKFMRAFFYFYLVNAFGDIPLVLGTDYKTNSLLPRSPKTQIYEQIINDLKDAKNVLHAEYLDGKLQPSMERIRPTKWAASALLSRAYLYNSDWTNAEAEASILISNSSIFSLESLDDVFKTTSKEAVWQIQTVSTDRGTEEAFLYILPSSGPNSNNPVSLSASLLNSIEADDQRKVKWVSSITPTVGLTYFYPAKYKENTLSPGTSPTQYWTPLRLAEQYLIRAEAQANGAGSGLPSAINDLNIIRSRAALPPYSGPQNNKDSVLTSILRERRIELFSEFGHRWLDLKRTSSVDSVMTSVTPIKSNGNTWKSYQQLYPIPINEIQRAPNLVQNPGYPN